MRHLALALILAAGCSDSDPTPPTSPTSSSRPTCQGPDGSVVDASPIPDVDPIPGIGTYLTFCSRDAPWETCWPEYRGVRVYGDHRADFVGCSLCGLRCPAGQSCTNVVYLDPRNSQHPLAGWECR
jgi:hypothetical protein